MLTFLSRPVVALGGALVIGAAIIAYALNATSVAPAGATTAVVRAPITEEVDVTGAVKAAQDTDLAFQTSGRVAAIKVAVGDHVTAGQTLLTLDGATQAAAVQVAEANLEVQQAKLASLEAGTRPEQLAIDETASAQAETALGTALTSAYATADDAVHAKADQAFTNPRTGNATLNVLVPDASLVTRVENERNALTATFAAWPSAPAADVSTLASQTTAAEADLRSVAAFLDDLAAALNEAQPVGAVSATDLAGYRSGVQAGRTSVSTALSALVSADTAAKQAAGALTLAQAGATADDVRAQQAAVDAAAASLASARAAAAETVITAPVSGTITVQQADPGETVTPGVPLVSMVADGRVEADTQVAGVDVAKLAVGDTVTATFDAYPGAIFPATVTTIDPAATVTNGIASYGVTVTFTTPDPRLRPGLTANLRIITKTVPDALQVPASAIIMDGTQAFVYVESAHGAVKTPVTVGVRSAGMAQVTGLAEGEQVLTFGASAGA
jgi:HlyD family secretion protein